MFVPPFSKQNQWNFFNFSWSVTSIDHGTLPISAFLVPGFCLFKLSLFESDPFVCLFMLSFLGLFFLSFFVGEGGGGEGGQ